MLIDLRQSSPLKTYKILSNTITPRPIAWVSTIFPNGLINLAPFSFFAPVSSNPPIFSLCLMQKADGEQKDTYKNIIATNKATIAMCDTAHLNALDCSAKELALNESEALAFDIALEIIQSSYPPAPKGVKVAFMCELHSELHLGENKTLLLRVNSAYIDENIYKDDLSFLPSFIARVGRTYRALGAEILPNALDSKDSKESQSTQNALNSKDSKNAQNRELSNALDSKTLPNAPESKDLHTQNVLDSKESNPAPNATNPQNTQDSQPKPPHSIQGISYEA